MNHSQHKSRPLRSFFPFLNDDFWEYDTSAPTGLSLSEDNSHVYIEAHLPGLKIEDIEVTFEKGVLWIRGEKKEEEEDKKKKYYRKASNSFSYRVQLPDLVDDQKEPEATYKDGVMRVSFFKSQGGQPKKINIQPK